LTFSILYTHKKKSLRLRTVCSISLAFRPSVSASRINSYISRNDSLLDPPRLASGAHVLNKRHQDGHDLLLYIHYIIHAYIYIYIHIKTYILICMYVYICIQIYIYTYMYIYIYIYTYMYIHIYIDTYMCIYLYLIISINSLQM
jgi:hypothetical protein